LVLIYHLRLSVFCWYAQFYLVLGRFTLIFLCFIICNLRWCVMQREHFQQYIPYIRNHNHSLYIVDLPESKSFLKVLTVSFPVA